MNKISSLPNQVAYSIWAYARGMITPQIHSKKQLHYTNVLTILEDNIPLWKQECSPDIKHFNKILNIEDKHTDLICRVLYECMEKNKTNIEFIKSRKPRVRLKTISKTKHPNLHKLVSNLNLDYIKQTQGSVIDCLNLLEKNDILRNVTILYEIFSPSSITTPGYQPFNTNNQTDIAIIAYVLKDPNVYKLLLSGLESDKNMYPFSDAYIEFYMKKILNYLMTTSLADLYKSTNLDKILDNIDKIFILREDKLIFLTGLTMLVAKNPLWLKNPEHLRNIYNAQFEAEYKLVITLNSLDITDFDTVITHVSGLPLCQKIESMEIPLL